ncbi:hypothetical protein DICPUDRAFT_17677, partial [Dictyostelium purpureum]
LIIAILFSIIYLFSYPNLKKNRPPSPLSVPIIGNLNEIIKNKQYLYLFDLYKKYGPIYQVKYGVVNTVVLCEYDILKEAFIDNGDIFMNRFVKISKLFKSQENIVNSNGKVWKKLHSIATQELLPNHKIKKYETMIIEEANKLLNKFQEQANNGAIDDPTANVKMCFLNIILSFLFNFTYEDYNDEIANKMVENIHKIFRFGAKPLIYDYIPFIHRFYKNEPKEYYQIFAEIYKFINDLVMDKLNSIDSETKPNCFVELLLLKYKSGELTMNEVLKTTTDILIAGSDTAALFILHLIMALSNRPEIQEKVYSEIKKDSIISYSNKNTTPYFNAVLKEVERLYTISPLSQPHSTNEDITLRGYFIPKTSQVIINTYAAHLSEKNWDKPLEFIPERFINDKQLEKKLLTFGIGPRNCLGFQFALQQVYLVAMVLFKSIKFSTVSNSLIPELREPGTTLAPLPFKVLCSKR